MNIFRAFLNFLCYIFAWILGLFQRSKPKSDSKHRVKFSNKDEQILVKKQKFQRRKTPAYGLFYNLESDEDTKNELLIESNDLREFHGDRLKSVIMEKLIKKYPHLSDIDVIEVYEKLCKENSFLKILYPGTIHYIISNDLPELKRKTFDQTVDELLKECRAFSRYEALEHTPI
ncbi:hypothetical protein PVAND_009002 [Polypedilum vanderplanki]|uniref:Uncharacterized protein n=1 Tax=Polypedilum vanderplanki TaxID=319348 RepID=A0A9J6CCF8_POLVA|nr:hypothetical protein PVAND_009002 [Polypedilum vanderplanki]